MKEFNELTEEIRGEFKDLLKTVGGRKAFADSIGVTYKSINAMLTVGRKPKPVPKWVKSALIVARGIKDSKQ